MLPRASLSVCSSTNKDMDELGALAVADRMSVFGVLPWVTTATHPRLQSRVAPRYYSSLK